LEHNDNIGGKYGTGFSSPSGGKGALWQAWKAKHGGRADGPTSFYDGYAHGPTFKTRTL
jgi:hypothetical protein